MMMSQPGSLPGPRPRLYDWNRALRSLVLAGMHPESSLPRRLADFRPVSSPIRAGISPLRPLLPRSSSVT